jgi:hypothetical protein
MVKSSEPLIKYSEKLDFNSIDPKTRALIFTMMDYMRSLGLKKSNLDLEKDATFLNQY